MEKVYSWNGWTCKPGDTVKVWRKVESRDPDGMGFGKKWQNSWVDGMIDCGSAKVREIDCDIGVGFFDLPYIYPLKALVPPEYFDMNQDNKPPKLEPFMRVRTRNGNVYIYCEGRFLKKGGYLGAWGFDDNLLNKDRNIDFDIVEIYEGYGWALALDFSNLGDLIWERKEEDPKLTALKKSLEELEAKAGDIKRQIEEFDK